MKSLGYFLSEFTIPPGLHSTNQHSSANVRSIFLSAYCVLGTGLATGNIKQSPALMYSYIQYSGQERDKDTDTDMDIDLMRRGVRRAELGCRMAILYKFPTYIAVLYTG